MSDGSPLAVLARIRSARPAPPVRAGERCELCAELIGDEHNHVVDIDTRALQCTCRPCYLLFTPDGAGGNRLRAVPERYASLPLQLAPAQWDALQIPVSTAFVFFNSSLGRLVAFYPSPAGATESLLPLDELADLLPALTPDVEALLLRADEASFIVPIDACYELVGRLRRTWRGFDGGQDARAELTAFFAGVAARAVRSPSGRERASR